MSHELMLVGAVIGVTVIAFALNYRTLFGKKKMYK